MSKLFIIFAIVALSIIGVSSYSSLNQKSSGTEPVVSPSPSSENSASPSAQLISPAPAASIKKIIVSPKSSVSPKPSVAASTAPAQTATPTPTPTPTPSPSVAPIESMIINGGAYININSEGPVPAGTLITANINGVTCGSTKARDSSQINFTMTIYSASQVPGCGTPGATMQFWVDNQKAMQTMPYYPGTYSGNVILNVSY